MDYKNRKNICIAILVISIISSIFFMIQFFDTKNTSNIIVEEQSTNSTSNSVQPLYNQTDMAQCH